jgi:hypothetical protein
VRSQRWSHSLIRSSTPLADGSALEHRRLAREPRGDLSGSQARHPPRCSRGRDGPSGHRASVDS